MLDFMLLKKSTTVGDVEKKMGCPGAFRNPDGRDTRGDKLLKTCQKDAKKRR